MKQVVHDPTAYTEDSTAWNDPGSLAPVGSDIMIQLPPGSVIHKEDWPDADIISVERIVQAKRIGYLTDRCRAMKYVLLDGSYVHGRFRWTHG